MQLKKFVPLKLYFMIPTIIFFLLRRYKRINPSGAARLEIILAGIGKRIVAFAIYFLITVFAFSQEKNLKYNIKRNGNMVGNILFTQHTLGNRTTLKLESEVRTRIIFLIISKAQEETIYDSGIMTWSSIFRKTNDNVKADKKTKATGNSYTIYKGTNTEILNNYPIRYNMLSIYILEPVNISKVYSDNFQQFVDILKLETQHYKIKFPDGNYNEYYYNNGVCTKVEVHNTLYRATIELNN